MAIATLVLGTCIALHLWSPDSSWRLEAFALAVLAVVLVEGGLYRIALSKDAPGPFGLQFGRIELRLLAAWALTLLFMFVLALLAFVVILAFAFAVASAGHGFNVALPGTWAAAVDPRGRIVVGVVAAAAAAGLIWAHARISLCEAACVDRERIQVLASWPDTRGRVVAILTTRVCLGALPIGFTITVFGLTASAHGFEGVLAWASSIAVGATIAGVWLPLSVGVCAYFYRLEPAG